LTEDSLPWHSGDGHLDWLWADNFERKEGTLVKKLIALVCLCAFIACGFAACDKKPSSPTGGAKPTESKPTPP
jgi:hypothetical protein